MEISFVYFQLLKWKVEKVAQFNQHCNDKSIFDQSDIIQKN